MDLSKIKHIHLIAICGTAMGALAGMLIKKGFRVSGSDEGVYPPMSDYLQNLGIHIMPGFKAENLDINPDLVIVGNTVKPANPEAVEMERRNLPRMHLPEAISKFLLKDKHSIVIAGTHGKTTTAALCSWIFESASLDPGFMVGGILKNFNLNAKAGNGSHFIIEGDEYDSAYFDKVPKFWHYRPQTAVITSVEFDHGDIYRDINHVKEAFARFASIIPEDGFLAASADYPHVRDVIKSAKCRILTYSFSDEADLLISSHILNKNGSEFSLREKGGSLLKFRSPLWGRHNVANAAAAASVAICHGISPSKIQEAFDTFLGVKRRQEIIYDKDGVIIIDDFAHHPTKVRETVKAVRSRFLERRLISVYEPRTNTSRRNFFQDIYPLSFDTSDMVIIAGVYNPHQIEPGKLMNAEKLALDIKNRGIDARYIASVDEIVEFLKKVIVKGDVILFMSNGGFGGIYKKIIEQL